MEISIHDFVLNYDLDVLIIDKIFGRTALCHHCNDYKSKGKLKYPLDKLIKLSKKSGELATRKLHERISKLNIKIHNINDCLSYLSE